MLLGIQVFGMMFGLVMLYVAYMNYKRKVFTIVECIGWCLLWVMFVVVSVFPELTGPFVRTLNIGRTLDLLIILGFMFFSAALFYCYSLIRNLQRRIEELVRRLALK